MASGTTGRAFGENYLARRGGVEVAGEFDGGTPFQRNAGHMILVSCEHHLLMDPTFAQFKKLGPAAIAMFVEEVDAAGNQREYWTVEDESFYVRYFAPPSYMPDDFPGVRKALSEAAGMIVANLYEHQHED